MQVKPLSQYLFVCLFVCLSLSLCPVPVPLPKRKLRPRLRPRVCELFIFSICSSIALPARIYSTYIYIYIYMHLISSSLLSSDALIFVYVVFCSRSPVHVLLWRYVHICTCIIGSRIFNLFVHVFIVMQVSIIIVSYHP